MTFSENFNEHVLNMEDLIPTGSEESEMLQYFPLVKICRLLHNDCINMIWLRSKNK